MPGDEGDDIGVRAHVEAAVLDHQAEPPPLERFKGPPQLLPAEGAAVDHHVVGLAHLPALAPHQSAGDLVAGQHPARPVRVGLQVPAGHLRLGLGPELVEQIAHLRVVGAEDGELEALTGRDADLFQFDDDAGGRPPRPGLHPMPRAVGTGEDERRWRGTELGQSGEAGDAAVGAAVAQRGVPEVHSDVGGAAVLADVAHHRMTLRAAPDTRVYPSWPPLRPPALLDDDRTSRTGMPAPRVFPSTAGHPGSADGGTPMSMTTSVVMADGARQTRAAVAWFLAGARGG